MIVIQKSILKSSCDNITEISLYCKHRNNDGICHANHETRKICLSQCNKKLNTLTIQLWDDQQETFKGTVEADSIRIKLGNDEFDILPIDGQLHISKNCPGDLIVIPKDNKIIVK